MSEREQHWAPKHFQFEATTLWSFPDGGSWATHEGGYRGNWSPYIPRNLILRYSRPGDLVVDPFVGGGTTAIEAKLLDRRCLALDINNLAIARTRTKLQFDPPPPVGEVSLLRGDARRLPVRAGVADLVLAHPPYANIIAYSRDQAGDLSHLTVPAFLEALAPVAAECRRVLRPDGICAVLIGDTRQHGNVVPLGMQTLGVFQAAGFAPKEIAIKAQHHTRMETLWQPRAQARNFLLLAHEYLFVLAAPIKPIPRT